MNVPANCRHCRAPLTIKLIDLGEQAVSNSYIQKGREHQDELVFPLKVMVCHECWLAQIDRDLPANEIFTGDYAYFSSFSTSWLKHCKNYADEMTEKLSLGPNNLVVEIASNDGYLLQYFVDKKVPVLGVEPSGSVANVAIERGIPTLVEFFGEDLAKRLVSEGFKPDLICSANVLAHVPDINDFVAGISVFLSGDAVYTVEFPHLLSLIQGVQFDTIYHEHYSYLSLSAIECIFAKAGIRIFDVETLSTHGGSLRVFACLNQASHSETVAVDKVRMSERNAKLNHVQGYIGFEPRVKKIRSDLVEFLAKVRAEGKKVAAYGAAAKGNTLLNYCGIKADDIAYCVDRNPAKQETLLPGSHIPVFDPEILFHDSPDYVLILPWNLKEEIMAQLEDLRKDGCKFVTAIPEVEVFG